MNTASNPQDLVRSSAPDTAVPNNPTANLRCEEGYPYLIKNNIFKKQFHGKAAAIHQSFYHERNYTIYVLRLDTFNIQINNVIHLTCLELSVV